jgi:hypothetical protein
MKFIVLVAAALPLALSPAVALALDLSTPERAVDAFFDAYARGSVDDILAARDFEFEARHAYDGTPGTAAPNEAAAKKAAKAKETALRTLLRAHPIHAPDRSQCKHLPTSPLRDDVARVALQCPSPAGAGDDMTETLLVVKSKIGWRVVLGLDTLFPPKTAP